MFGALVPFLLFFLNFEKVKFQKLGPGTSSGAWVHEELLAELSKV